MKKIMIMIILTAVMLAAFTSCSAADNNQEIITETVTTYTLKEGVTLSGIVKDANKEIGINMPVNVSDETLNSIFKISPSAVADYAGKFTISASCADCFIVIEAAEGKGSVVEHGLNQRKQDLIDTFTGYIKESLDQAENAQIIVRGNYYIFSSLDCSPETIMQFIDSYFDVTETTVQK